MDMTNETTPPIETGEQPAGESLAPRPAAKRTVPQKPKKPRVGGAPSDPLADMLTRVRNGPGARPRRRGWAGKSSPTSGDMSRIGRLPVQVPQGVDVKIDGHIVRVKGPKGELVRTFHPDVSVTREDGTLVVSRKDDAKATRA